MTRINRRDQDVADDVTRDDDDDPAKLTIEQVKDMTADEINEHWDDVQRVLKEQA